jgi:hypothetical protein
MRDRMRTRGLAQAARFSWERAAAETEAIYDTILNAKQGSREQGVS